MSEEKKGYPKSEPGPEGSNHPIDEVLLQASLWHKLGHTIHQRYTCAGCGKRQIMEQPNAFFKRGRCEECGVITDIEKAGCNFAVIMEVPASDGPPSPPPSYN